MPVIMSSQCLNLDRSDPLNTLCDLNLCCVMCVLLYYQMLKSDQITVKYILIDIPTYVTKYQVHFQVNSIAPKNSLWHYACNRLGTNHLMLHEKLGFA